MAAIDKQTIIDRLLSGYGVPIDTLETPDYDAYDPTIKTPYDPDAAVALLAASGYSPDNPVKFKIQTTKDFKPKDYEMIQAIVGLWRKVGIEAEIEVYEIAKHYELRAADQLAPVAFYNWGNSVGDPTTSTGFAMFGPSPHSAWDSQDLIDKIGPLWGEADEARRIQGWKDVDRYIAENAYVIPLLQYVQPILSAAGVTVTPACLRCALAASDEAGLRSEAAGCGGPIPLQLICALLIRLVTAAITLFGVAVILFAVIFTAVNLAVDLCYAALSPRLRHA